MLFFIGSCIAFNFCHIFYCLLVFTERKQYLLYLCLIVVNMRIHGNVFYDVAFALEGIFSCSFRGRNVGGDLWLIGASHLCYIILSVVQISEETLLFQYNAHYLRIQNCRMIGKSDINGYHYLLQEYRYFYNNKYTMSNDKQDLSVQEKTQRFFKVVQAGDISLFQIFDEAVAVFGFTKVGKTSSCHIISNNSPLKAENHNGDLIYRPTTQKYYSAAVGLSTESETQIPNIFETRFRDKNNAFKTVFLLDQPGYGDTYGFHRIFSNGYFHYRTFSKTPKLKFVLAMKKVHLDDTGEKFKSTIQNFINTFVRYDQIKASIMGATTFLITQVESKTTIDNIKNIITRLRNESVKSMTTDQKNRYQEFIDNMINNNKIFIIQKPDQVGSQTKQNDILKQIYQKTKFWQREVKNGIVDMKEINFSCGGQILNELFSFKGKAVFKLDFEHFMKYTQNRINQILLNHPFSLRNIVQTLKKDAIGSVDSHKFLKDMAQFVNIFYKYDEHFKGKRQKTEAHLFNLSQLNQVVDNSKGFLNKQVVQAETEYRQREMKQVYFIKKFKVLQFIKQKTDAIIPDPKVERSVYWLEAISTYFLELFRKFNVLRVQKTDSQRIIYKYSYVIQRLIEQAKITTLILFSNEQLRKRFDEYKENMVDIFRPLKDKLFSQFGDIRVAQMKEEFIGKIDLSRFDIVNKDIISFFESIKVDKKTRLKLAQLVIKYAQTIKDKKNIKDDEKKFVINKLLAYRNQFYQDKSNQNSKSQKSKSIQNVFTISNILGHFLLNYSYYKQARQVYQSTNNADQVFKIYQMELTANDKNNPEKCRSLLLQYGKYAGYCHREQLAMKCFQEAYSKSKTYQQIKEVSAQIIQLKKAKPKDDQNPYLAKFFQQDFCSAFSEGLINTIEILSKPSQQY